MDMDEIKESILEKFDEIKEKYNDFIAELEDKGVPAPQILVPVLIIAVLAIAGFFLASYTGAVGNTKTIAVRVLDHDGNSIPRANVCVLDYNTGEEIDCASSGEDGIATFSNIPKNRKITIKATKSGFEEKDLSDVTDNKPTLYLDSAPQTPPTSSITVRVSDEYGPVSMAPVGINYSNGDQDFQFTDDSGEVSFDVNGDIPDSATIAVTAEGYEDFSQTYSKAQLSSGINIMLTSATTPTPTPTFTPTTAHVTVDVYSGGAPLPQIKVSLIGTDNSVIDSDATGSDGMAFFTVDIGASFYVLAEDPQHKYLKFKSKLYTAEDDSDIVVSAPMQPAQIPQNILKIKTVDENGTAIEGATVDLFSQSDSSFLGEKETDLQGFAEFEISPGVRIYATAYKDGLLPNRMKNLMSGVTKTIVLHKKVVGSFYHAVVVVGDNGNLISNAQVTLYSSDGYNLGLPAEFTDDEGVVQYDIPAQIERRHYSIYASATKDEKVGKSDVAYVGSDVNLSIELVAPDATAKLTAYDFLTKKVIPNVKFEALNEKGRKVGQCTTANGSCSIKFEPTGEFSFRALSPSYQTQTISNYTFKPREKKEIEFYLIPKGLSKKVRAEFVGVFNRDGKEVREISNAGYYIAKFVVSFPENSNKAGFFVRLGNEANVEDDVAGIYRVVASGIKGIEKSKSFNPSANASDDMANAPAKHELYKWANVDLTPVAGSTQIRVEFETKKKISAPQLDINYRAYMVKEGLWIRSPEDKNFGFNASTPDLDGLYARTKTISVPFSKSPFICEGFVCYKIYFEDKEEGTIGEDGFPVKLGKDFLIHYEILAASSGISSLKLSSKSIAFKGSAAMQKANEISFASPSEHSQTIPLNLKVGEKKSGAVLASPTAPDSYAQIKFNFIPADSSLKPVVISKFVSVEGRLSFKSLTVKPENLNVLERKNVRVGVKDSLGRPVTDAKVSLEDCDGEPLADSVQPIVGDGERFSGEDGIYVFKNVEPKDFGTIGIRVSKEGYKTKEECILPVNAGDFIDVSKETITLEGKSHDNPGETVTVSNLLSSSELKLSSSMKCDLAHSVPERLPKPFVIFPQYARIKAGEDLQVKFIPVDNVTAKGECIVTFTAKAGGRVRSTKRLFVTLNLVGPGIVPSSSTGYCSIDTLGDLMNIELFTSQKLYSWPCGQFVQVPTCTLEGPLGQYVSVRCDRYGAYFMPLSSNFMYTPGYDGYYYSGYCSTYPSNPMCEHSFYGGFNAGVQGMWGNNQYYADFGAYFNQPYQYGMFGSGMNIPGELIVTYLGGTKRIQLAASYAGGVGGGYSTSMSQCATNWNTNCYQNPSYPQPYNGLNTRMCDYALPPISYFPDGIPKFIYVIAGQGGMGMFSSYFTLKGDIVSVTASPLVPIPYSRIPSDMLSFGFAAPIAPQARGMSLIAASGIPVCSVQNGRMLFQFGVNYRGVMGYAATSYRPGFFPQYGQIPITVRYKNGQTQNRIIYVVVLPTWCQRQVTNVFPQLQQPPVTPTASPTPTATPSPEISWCEGDSINLYLSGDAEKGYSRTSSVSTDKDLLEGVKGTVTIKITAHGNGINAYFEDGVDKVKYPISKLPSKVEFHVKMKRAPEEGDKVTVHMEVGGTTSQHYNIKPGKCDYTFNLLSEEGHITPKVAPTEETTPPPNQPEELRIKNIQLKHCDNKHQLFSFKYEKFDGNSDADPEITGDYTKGETLTADDERHKNHRDYVESWKGGETYPQKKTLKYKELWGPRVLIVDLSRELQKDETLKVYAVKCKDTEGLSELSASEKMDHDDLVNKMKKTRCDKITSWKKPSNEDFLLSTTSQAKFDGTDSNNNKLPNGVYAICVAVENSNGIEAARCRGSTAKADPKDYWIAVLDSPEGKYDEFKNTRVAIAHGVDVANTWKDKYIYSWISLDKLLAKNDTCKEEQIHWCIWTKKPSSSPFDDSCTLNTQSTFGRDPIFEKPLVSPNAYLEGFAGHKSTTFNALKCGDTLFEPSHGTIDCGKGLKLSFEKHNFKDGAYHQYVCVDVKISKS